MIIKHAEQRAPQLSSQIVCEWLEQLPTYVQWDLNLENKSANIREYAQLVLRVVEYQHVYGR